MQKGKDKGEQCDVTQSIIKSIIESLIPKFKHFGQFNQVDLSRQTQLKIIKILETDIRFTVFIQQDRQSLRNVAILILKDYYEQANLDFNTMKNLLKKIRQYQLHDDIILPLMQKRFSHFSENQILLSYEQIFPQLQLSFSYKDFINYFEEWLHEDMPTRLINNKSNQWKNILKFLNQHQQMEKKSQQNILKQNKKLEQLSKKNQIQRQRQQASRKVLTQSVFNQEKEKINQSNQNQKKRSFKINVEANVKYFIQVVKVETLQNGQESKQVQSLCQSFSGDQIIIDFLPNKGAFKETNNKIFVVG